MIEPEKCSTEMLLPKMFEKLNWKSDQMTLNGLNFRLQHTKDENWEGGSNHFIFYKVKGLIDQYESFFKNYPESATPKNVLESVCGMEAR